MGMGEIELKDILDKHGKWLRNDTGGERADLTGADLRDANLRGADLRDANLRGADLRDADLRDANLRDANLRDADLRDADLRDADLRDANLRGADLRDANLRDADLRDFKEDLFKTLELAKPEVVGLYEALMRGRINGSVYAGECACLKGTIANCRGVKAEQLEGMTLNASLPAESWFLGIRKGDVPSSSQICDVTREWIEEFALVNQIALPKFKLVSSIEMPEAFT